MSNRIPTFALFVAIVLAVVFLMRPWESTDPDPIRNYAQEGDTDPDVRSGTDSSGHPERQSIQPEEATIASKGIPWSNDPETVKNFLAAYNRLIPRSLEATDELRSKRNPTWVQKLNDSIEACKNNLMFNDLSPSDFEGLAYDTLLEAQNSLSSQARFKTNWDLNGRRFEDLPQIQGMLSEPHLYPPEFIIFKLAGHLEISFSDEDLNRVNKARNVLVRELALIRGMEFELEPAVSWAAKEIGVDWRTITKHEVISEWNDISGLRQRELDTYRNLMHELGSKYAR